MTKLLRRNSGNGRLRTWDGSKDIPVSYVLNEYEAEDGALSFSGTINTSDALALFGLMDAEAYTLTLEDARRIRVLVLDQSGTIKGTHGCF
jgi:hypothetical protein